MKYSAVIASTVLACCSGCGQDQPRDTKVSLPSNIEINKPSYPGQRFLTTNTAHLAFDTQTGALCKTWKWEADSAYSIGWQTSTCAGIVDDERQRDDAKQVEMARAAKGK